MNKTYIISLTIFLNLSYSVYRYYDYKMYLMIMKY